MSERNTHLRRKSPELAEVFNATDQVMPDVTADDAVPQQADASQEGPGPAGKESDRKEEIFDLLKRVIEGGEKPVLAAREFGARRDALLMETAAEIEEFERNIEATIHQLMDALKWKPGTLRQQRPQPTTQKWRGERPRRGDWPIVPLLKRSGPRRGRP